MLRFHPAEGDLVLVGLPGCRLGDTPEAGGWLPGVKGGGVQVAALCSPTQTDAPGTPKASRSPSMSGWMAGSTAIQMLSTSTHVSCPLEPIPF